MIRLTKHASLDQPRRIPIQLLGTAWLNPHMLIGLSLFAGSLVNVASIVKSGKMPTDVALMIDHASAQATIDAVHTRTKTKGKNMKVIEHLHDYHFQTAAGQRQRGTSISSSKNFGKVATVLYYPANPQINRLQGMSAEQDGYFRFSLIMVVGCAIMMVVGILRGCAAYRLLRFATLGQATVVACRRTDNAKTTIVVNDLSVTLPGRPSSLADEIPLAQYQSMILEQKKVQYDSKGKYIGTAAQRSIGVAMAAGFGFFFGLILGGMVTVIAFQNLGLPQLMLGCASGAVIGAIVLAITETQSRFFLRGNAPKPDAKPAGFVKCTCVLEVAPTRSMPMVIRLTKKLDLTGDSSDGQPRAILYFEDRPTSSMLLSELGLNGNLDATSGDIVLEGRPYLPALIVLAMIIIVAIVGVMVA